MRSILRVNPLPQVKQKHIIISVVLLVVTVFSDPQCGHVFVALFASEVSYS